MLVGALLASLLGVVFVASSDAEDASAAESTRWQAGNIISDALFFDGDSMTGQQVLAFMEQQNPGCAAGARCITTYRQSTPTLAANAYCGAYAGGSSQHAATIVAQVGLACGVSPRVLLVLLQKEQSLITATNPSQRQFDAATGFACPDTAPCDSSYGSFFYQVYYAARQFQVYRAFPSSYNHRAEAWNSVLYHPNSACGSSRVYIANQATAGLYNYTPYQPNAAAMSNLYGTGDSCSAYGNRNFWRMWTDWFGNPSGPTGPPIGKLDGATAVVGGVRVTGWALDPDTSAPIRVHAYVDGAGAASFEASLTRADVGAAHPYAGPDHGFNQTITGLAIGAHEVCLYALNAIGPGGTVALGCRSFTVTEVPTGLAGKPLGSVDSITAVGDDRVQVTGWTADPDTTRSTSIHIYVDGAFAQSATASITRADVGAAYPTLGPDHGFNVTLAGVAAGARQICVFAIDIVGGDGNRLMRCSTVTVEGSTGREGAPVGALESVAPVVGGDATVTGWALDLDTRASIRVHIYVDGVARLSVLAGLTRDDLAADYPNGGVDHGFEATVHLGPGTHRVCAYGIDLVGRDGNRLLGCTSVAMPGSLSTNNPTGRIDSVTAVAGGVRVTGWALDPNVSAPIRIHIYVGSTGRAITADLARNDIAARYPVYGANHGFNAVVPVQAGTYDVCVYAINQGAGNNTTLTCRSVTVR